MALSDGDIAGSACGEYSRCDAWARYLLNGRINAPRHGVRNNKDIESSDVPVLLARVQPKQEEVIAAQADNVNIWFPPTPLITSLT